MHTVGWIVGSCGYRRRFVSSSGDIIIIIVLFIPLTGTRGERCGVTFIAKVVTDVITARSFSV